MSTSDLHSPESLPVPPAAPTPADEGGRVAAEPPTPPPGAAESMGSSVTPHALFSRSLDGELKTGVDTPESNPTTTPESALQKGPENCRLITAGIDTLDLGFYVQWPSARLHVQLEHLREEARGTDGIQPNDWEPCLVLPSGKPPMYRYHVQYPEGQMYFSESHELKNHPNVYVSLSSRSLWTKGVQTSVFLFKERIEAFGGVIERIVPSRVDLAADLFIPGGLSFEFLKSHLVSKSRTLRPVLKNDLLETLYVGDKTSPIQLRIYDKWKEILHSDKVFFFDVWREKGIQGGEWLSMWRVEGQFRRTILKEFGIHTLEDLYARLADLWAYFTEWASLRRLDDDNSARRSLHPLWEMVQSAGKLLGDPAGVSRQVNSDSTAPVEWYVRHITGCLVAFASRLNVTSLADAISRLRQSVERYMPENAFAARVHAELVRLGMVATLANGG